MHILEPSHGMESANKVADMELERILGLTSSNRNSFVCQPKTGNLIYLAGSTIVVLDPRLRNQSHLISSSKDQLTCLAISENGRFLASASCAPMATIEIWDMQNRTIIGQLKGHEVEVSCLCFSPDNRYLVSVGSKQDMCLHLWDWRCNVQLASHKLVMGRVRACSFSADCSYFVTVGEVTVNYWDIQTPSQSEPPSRLTLSCSSASLGEQKRKSFCDIKCGRGPAAGSSYCITKCGILCELGSRRAINKWVDLRTPAGANCLAIGGEMLAIGCANGVCRCFDTSELRFIRNLPRPHALGQDVGGAGPREAAVRRVYPNAVAVSLEASMDSVALIYSDRSIYAWDLATETAADSNNNVREIFSTMYHSSCIWGLDTICQSGEVAGSEAAAWLPPGSFISCSSDDTLRVWRPAELLSCWPDKLSSSTEAPLSIINHDHHAASEIGPLHETVRILFTDSESSKYFPSQLDGVDAAGNCSMDDKTMAATKTTTTTTSSLESSEGLRCLRVSPCGSQLAVGSRSGAIRIYDFELNFSQIKCIAAHDSEVLCLEYSDPVNFMGLCLLASASRDKLIHIFDASNDYTFLQTIDDHLSSITGLSFFNSRQGDHWAALQLISCGADHRIILRRGRPSTDGRFEFAADQIVEGKSIFYDMQLDGARCQLATACQDRTVRLFSLNPVGHLSSFHSSATGEGTLIKIALHPSGTMLATSSTDKSVSIHQLNGGRRVACVSNGLSDLVTSLRFSADGRRLIGCSGDGCIFVWRCPPMEATEAAKSMKDQPSHQQTGYTMVRCRSQAQLLDNEPNEEGLSSNDNGLAARHARLNDGLELSRSRDELDCIANRRRLINDSLEHADRGHHQPPRHQLNGARVQGANKRVLGSSYSGIYNSRSEPNPATKGMKLSGAKNHESDEDDDDDDDEDDDVQLLTTAHRLRPERPITPPKPSPHRQIRRVSGQQVGRRSSADGEPLTAATRLFKSELHLASQPTPTEPADRLAGDELSGCRGNSTATGSSADVSLNSPRLRHMRLCDLDSYDPVQLSSVSQELCQQVGRELSSLSQYATRLHRRLMQDGDEPLARALARSIKGAMDILSIVGQPVESPEQGRQSLGRVSRRPTQPDAPASGPLSRRSKSQVRPTAADDGSRGRLKLDQVLEAYSDRLFRMVQEKMADQHERQARTLPLKVEAAFAAANRGANLRGPMESANCESLIEGRD